MKYCLADGYVRTLGYFTPNADAVEFMSDCKDERQAAQMLGFNKNSWDNVSGKEKQPKSSSKIWEDMTIDEKTALVVLGYDRHSWDHRTPFVLYKYWGELTVSEKLAATKLGYSQLICL